MPKEEFELIDKKKSGWKFQDGSFKPFNELTPKELQKCLTIAQRKELNYHNKATFFGLQAADILEEAEKRGITLKESNTDFHNNNRKLQNAIKK